MSRYALCLLLLTLIARPAIAAEPSKAETFAPEIARLIDKLGDGDPAARHAAGKRLREIGRLAIPQLKASADSTDPQVRLEVHDALTALDRPPLPKLSKNYSNETLNVVTDDDDSSTIDIKDGDLKMRVYQKNRDATLHRDIKLTITGPVNGKPTKQIIEASDDQQLKWIAPEAWKIYNRYFSVENEMSQTRTEAPELESWVKKQIKTANLGPADAKRLKDSLKALVAANTADLRTILFDPTKEPERLSDAFRCSDAFRHVAADLKLGELPASYSIALPPEARLGVRYSDNPEKTRPPDIATGVVIMYVANGSIAQRMGMKSGDVVQKINGIDVDDGSEMWRATSSRLQNRDADVIRDFKPVHLVEKSGPTTKQAAK